MLAVYAKSQSADDPLSGLEVAERPDPEVPAGWVAVRLRTAALNHHDVWSLRGVGLSASRIEVLRPSICWQGQQSEQGSE